MPRYFFAMLALMIPALACAESLPGFKLPWGFEITEYAGNDLAPDITCLTIDAKGRITVAGRGYIRILIDETNSGKATKAIDFTKNVKDAAHGLLWEGDKLLAVVDGGLWRYSSDGSRELLRKLKTGGEHHAHAIARGPDDWLYLLCGNNAGIDRSYATAASSPIRDPVAGCVVRFSPDFKESEIVADGFRNPYGFAFNANGDLFTFDSDNERCVSLPWYEGTRFYHVRPGGHYGWRNPQICDTWRLPPYFADVMPPLADLGRGSPTGVAACRLPVLFGCDFLLLDWTFGRIYMVALKRAGDGYSAGVPRPLLAATGENGFAPTAIAIYRHDLFVSIGGRGTRGAVYRIQRNRMGSRLPDLAEGVRGPPTWRDWFQTDLPLAARKHEADALVDLYKHREHFDERLLATVVEANWSEQGRFLRQAAAQLFSALSRESQDELQKKAQTARQLLIVGFGRLATTPNTAIGMAIQAFNSGTPEERLDSVRLMQLALGDLTSRESHGTVFEGYTPRRPIPPDAHPELRKLVREAFPAGHANLDRELSRTLAMFEDDQPATIAKMLAKITAQSDPVEDIHYLIVLARLRAARNSTQTQATATALLALDDKINKRKLNRDTNWPLRVAEMHAELARKDVALNGAIVKHAEFGRPDHVLFARCPGFDRKAAAEVIVSRLERGPILSWTPELVGLLGELPAERWRPISQRLWERGGLDDALLPLLARDPKPEDAGRLLGGLTSPRLATVSSCLDALEKIALKSDAATAFALVRGLRMLPEGKAGDELRQRIAAILQAQTKQRFGVDKQRWSDWLAKTYPEFAVRLGGPDGVDVAAWQKRLAGVAWSKGNAERGKAIFTKASCAACHSGSQALGPDLNGVASRFSRADLFTAIIQPSKDISPRYRTTQIDTTDGKTFVGLIVYEATDGVILQTGPAETVRIAGDKIESRRITETSLMPAGLLDKFGDGDIADLDAFLRASVGR